MCRPRIPFKIPQLRNLGLEQIKQLIIIIGIIIFLIVFGYTAGYQVGQYLGKDLVSTLK